MTASSVRSRSTDTANRCPAPSPSYVQGGLPPPGHTFTTTSRAVWWSRSSSRPRDWWRRRRLSAGAASTARAYGSATTPCARPTPGAPPAIDPHRLALRPGDGREPRHLKRFRFRVEGVVYAETGALPQRDDQQKPARLERLNVAHRHVLGGRELPRESGARNPSLSHSPAWSSPATRGVSAASRGRRRPLTSPASLLRDEWSIRESLATRFVAGDSGEGRRRARRGFTAAGRGVSAGASYRRGPSARADGPGRRGSASPCCAAPGRRGTPAA